jgi:hypothetical protein
MKARGIVFLSRKTPEFFGIEKAPPEPGRCFCGVIHSKFRKLQKNRQDSGKNSPGNSTISPGT